MTPSFNFFNTPTTVHPSSFVDVEKGEKIAERISRKSSFMRAQHDEESATTAESVEEIRRTGSSCVSLSGELVEAVIYDGQYRFISEQAHETAMWCGLVSFLVMGVGLVVIGLYMALTN